jgi:ABC-type phosphate transport system auxiliary subunit
MNDMIEAPSDEQVYEAWQGSSKSFRVLAREMGLSVMQVEQSVDRMLPVFDAQTNLRALKREIQQVEDLTRKFYEKAMREMNIECAHLVARLNERTCAMRGITSLTIKLDPVAAQVAEQPKRFDRMYEQIMNFKHRNDGNGAALAPPSELSSDDRNRSDSE